MSMADDARRQREQLMDAEATVHAYSRQKWAEVDAAVKEFVPLAMAKRPIKWVPRVFPWQIFLGSVANKGDLMRSEDIWIYRSTEWWTQEITSGWVQGKVVYERKRLGSSSQPGKSVSSFSSAQIRDALTTFLAR